MSNLETIELKEDKLNLLLMTGTFCAPCRFVKPVFQKFIDSNTNESVNPVIHDVLEVDPEFVRTHKVLSVPTLLVFRGKEHRYTFNETEQLTNEDFYKSFDL